MTRNVAAAADSAAELPLEEAEALSQFVFDSVTEYAIFTMSPDGIIATWNSGAERTFGYAADEMIGRHFAAIFTGEDQAAGMPAAEMRSALEFGRLDRDCWHVRKDASLFWGTNTVQPLLDAEGRRHGFTKIVRDSTERYEAAIALRQSEERFRLLVESVKDYALFSIAPDGSIVLWNSGAELIFGYTAAEIIGKPFANLFTPEEVQRGSPQSELGQAAKTGEVENERWQLRADGSRFMARRRISRLKPGALGAAEGFAVIAHDVTEARANEKTMWNQAFHDELTGLPNRALFVEHLQRTMAHCTRHPGARFAVLFLDLDQFKSINDRVGHVLADRLLTEVGERLRTCVRPEDVVARLGGDEFTVLVSSMASSRQVMRLAARIHRAMEPPFYVETHTVQATTSIGVALGPGLYQRGDEIIHDADIAMYESKSRGRSNTVVFDGRMRATVVSRDTLEHELRVALEREELFLEYQPIVGLRDLRVVGFEALVRWKHPVHGILQPGDFIDTAEHSGLIVDIDHWVLATACAQLRTWQAGLRRLVPLTMSVNLSAKQFSHEDLCRKVEAVLGDSKVAASSVRFDITETTMHASASIVASVLAELRTLQVEIHIDDFGTGYSSLRHLGVLPVNAVKINRSFLAGMQASREQIDMVRTIVALAHNLRLAVIAEGVETDAELELLRELSCEFAQGFLFSAPLGAIAASALLAAGGQVALINAAAPVPALAAAP